MSKFYLLLAILVFLCGPCFTQQNWSRVKIFGSDLELRGLGTLGLPVDHGEHKKDTYFMTDLSDLDIAKLDQNGYAYEIVIQDVKAYYLERNENPRHRDDRAACPAIGAGPDYNPTTPANFQLGSMAGFYTYQEYLDEIDSMRSKYPNLISSKTGIDTYLTLDGNPIYWLRISDNPNSDEAEEEVLYSSLHHAREPASLSQTIYFMWYMLENYGLNDEVTYLINNTEMYFVPMLNPDGYQYNELMDPGGGGMHRKNRRNVGNSNKGVDLNRNYAYHWNESGTSPDVNSDTYAGTGPFSEVETQAMKWFCEQRDFKFAFNAHTHGNLLLYPIGWSHVEVAPEVAYFEAYTNHMVKHNGYSNIKSSDLYPASGVSDDWMYMDDSGTKPSIFAITPEVSSEGTANDFWPPSVAIEEICKANVHMNMTLAHMPLIFGVTTDLEPSKVTNINGYFKFELERLGLTNGDITVGISPIAGIQTIGPATTHTLNLMDIVEDSIQYSLHSGIQFGDPITYIIETDNGTWTRMDTIYKTFGAGTVVFYDNGSNVNNWTGGWSFTNENFVSPNNCITDSPFVNHQDNDQSECELNQSFTFDNATYAYVNFWAKWEIENDYDYVQFMISVDDGSSWTPLCGKYTNQGVPNQDFDNPLYDDFQYDWVFEEIDLIDYLGELDVKFKFRLISDASVAEDGFYFDDFQIFTDGAPDASGVDEFGAADIKLFPNPVADILSIVLENPFELNRIEITNELGQIVKVVTPTSAEVVIGIADLAEGIYFLSAYNNKAEKITKRFTIIR